MTNRFAEIAFTDGVRAAQSDYGSSELADRLLEHGRPNDEFSQTEQEFIESRDSFYLATVSETGWPYIQHRGGPTGFVKVLNPQQLAFADFRGNRQLISTGNASANERCSMIFMDYLNRRRLKVFGLLRMQNRNLVPVAVRKAVRLADYRARVERVAMIDVLAFDWNCSRHITRRYTEAEIRASFDPGTNLRTGRRQP